MAQAKRKAKFEARGKTANRQKGRQPRTHSSAKKPKKVERTTLTIEDLFLAAPDKEWAPVPFADADVLPAQLIRAKEKAVEAMTEWGVLVEASRASRIGRTKLKHYMRTDPEFKARMQAARQNNNERIEREMRRRGMLPKGELAAIFVMKHNIPRYREIQRVELTGRNGAPVAYVDAKAELLKRIEALALKAKGEAIAVGERPRLLKGGSDEKVEVHTIRKVKGEGFNTKSRK